MSQEAPVAKFEMQADGSVHLVGGVWPTWMHIDPAVVVDASAEHIRVEAGHIVFTMANGSARYVISGFANLNGWPCIIADRVG